MKPVTKFDKEIVRVNKKVRKIKIKQIRWAYKYGLDHIAVRTKSGRITCLDCGHKWQSDLKQGWQDQILEHTCPNCKIPLKIEQTQKRTFRDSAYIGILETCENYQIIRLFEIWGYYNSGHKAELGWYERSRIIMNDKGQHGIVGQHGTMGWSTQFGGTFELRNKNSLNLHNINPYKFYPEINVIPILKRNGFNGDLYGFTPYTMFHSLITNNMAETFLKLNELDLFEYAVKGYGKEQLKRYWPSIKICIKNNYKIKDIGDWLDYLTFLERYGKDVHNVKYICPVNFKKEHDKYVEKERRRREQQKVAELKKEIAIAQRKYLLQKRKYFDLSFIDNELQIEPIKSVKQLLAESDIFSHCAFSGAYHKKENSLLFSARINNIPVETIEFCLRNFAIIQARGKNNKSSKYNKRIVEFFNQNIPEIIKAHKSKPKAKPRKKKPELAMAV